MLRGIGDRVAVFLIESSGDFLDERFCRDRALFIRTDRERDNQIRRIEIAVVVPVSGCPIGFSRAPALVQPRDENGDR